MYNQAYICSALCLGVYGAAELDHKRQKFSNVKSFETRFLRSVLDKIFEVSSRGLINIKSKESHRMYSFNNKIEEY